MTSQLFYLLLISYFAIQPSISISLNSSLFPITTPTSWRSPSGRFAFGFYPEGSGFSVGSWLITPQKNTVIWTAFRGTPPFPKSVSMKLNYRGLQLNYRGLQLINKNPALRFISNINSTANSASILDSGNFVIYGAKNEILWQTFDYPTDTIMAGQKLSQGGTLSVAALPTIIKKVVSAPNGNLSVATSPIIIKKKIVSTKFLVVSGIVIAVLVFVLGFLVCRYRNSRMRRSRMVEDNLAFPRWFSYRELSAATCGFKEKLGKGSFGTVFKGALSMSQGGVQVDVAVKRLEKVVEEGEREFRAEMKTIGRTHHKNLVQLLGFCEEGSNRLLVYELMSNGSLASIIFNSAGARPHWIERVRIVLDIARGINYLHEDCETCIIHCDIKPQNILMDNNWTAKISDFGLAKLLMPSQTRTFTEMRGTRGYLAPEWAKNVPISVKADVYSFGVVLLEIICCRRNMEPKAQSGEIILTEWAYNCFVGEELSKLVDQDEEVDQRELERLVKVGLWCIQNEPILRPYMNTVVMVLEENAQVPVPPPPASAV